MRRVNVKTSYSSVQCQFNNIIHMRISLKLFVNKDVLLSIADKLANTQTKEKKCHDEWNFLRNNCEINERWF